MLLMYFIWPISHRSSLLWNFCHAFDTLWKHPPKTLRIWELVLNLDLNIVLRRLIISMGILSGYFRASYLSLSIWIKLSPQSIQIYLHSYHSCCFLSYITPIFLHTYTSSLFCHLSHHSPYRDWLLRCVSLPIHLFISFTNYLVDLLLLSGS